MESTFKKSPKHDCGRCGCTRSLSELIWENGVLVCRRGGCKDEVTLQQQDAAYTRVVESLVDSRELQPDDKLVTPSPASDDIYFDI